MAVRPASPRCNSLTSPCSRTGRAPGKVSSLSAIERPLLVNFPEPGIEVFEVACGTVLLFAGFVLCCDVALLQMHVLALARGGAVYSWGNMVIRCAVLI